jgi:soluble lytic murein transglycosylase-like protein
MRKPIVPFMTGLSLIFCTVLSPLFSATASAQPLVDSSSPKAVSAYATVLQKINPQLPQWQSRELASHVLSNAARWRVNANLLVALVTVESAWHTQARSRVGAMGLGQLMPGTAALLGVNPHNPYQNLAGAARYLSGLLSRYRGKADRYQLACAAYNAGPKAVSRFGGIPPYAETAHYVVKVMSTWSRINHVVRSPRAVVAVSAVPVDRSEDVQYWSAAATR